MSPDDDPLDKARHIRYLQRCYRTFLPTAYTSHDSTRLTLASFVVAALDLLTDEGQSFMTIQERRRVRQWVLSLQHPDGGFCGSPNHLVPRPGCSTYASTPNIAATCFALFLLALCGGGAADGADSSGGQPAASAFAGLNRVATLRWLRRLQRDDGSFGEVLVGNGDGVVAGGNDMRYCYLAATIRWCLRAPVEEGQVGWVEDINVPALVEHIRKSQTYDGGTSETCQNEPHAGYAFCAVAALAMLERPPDGSPTPPGSPVLKQGVVDLPKLQRFLVFRQLACLEDNEDEDGERDAQEPPEQATASDEVTQIGYNGRTNKDPDTCYYWWTSGALEILGCIDLLDSAASRRFLLRQMQHMIGGFSKHIGGPPDIYHSFLGLAALALHGEPGLRKLDAPLCLSSTTVERIAAARTALIEEEQRINALVDGPVANSSAAAPESRNGGVSEELSSILNGLAIAA